MNFSAQNLIDDIHKWLNIDTSHHFHFNSSGTPPIRSGDIITVESVMQIHNRTFLFYKNNYPVFAILIDNIFNIDCIMLAFYHKYNYNYYEIPVRYYIRADGTEIATRHFIHQKTSQIDICNVDELYSYAKKCMSIPFIEQKFEHFPKLSFLQRILDDINKNKEIVIEI